MPLTLAALIPVSTFAQSGAIPAAPAAASTRLPSRMLTLARAIELALRENPELSAARREIDATEGAHLQAGARPNPQLGFEHESVRRESRTTTVLLSQPIELGGKRGARLAAAERERDIAQIQLVARSAKIRSAVTGAYFDTLIAQERVRLADTSLQVAQSGSQAAARRVSAGKVAPVEETRAKLAESGARIELVQAHSELQAALYELAATIGSKGPSIERVEGAVEVLPSIPAIPELERLLAASPALRLAQLEVDRQGARVELERSRRVPDLTVSVGAKRDAELGRKQAVLGLSIPLPLLDTNRGGLLEALHRRDKARDEAEAGATRLRAEALRARERLVAADAEAQALQREVLPGATQAYEAASKGFELGKFSFLEALDAQRSLLMARSQYLRALEQAHRARSDLDRILGIDEPPTGRPAR